MGEVEKVLSLLGILAGSIPGMRERIRCWGSGLAAASIFFFFPTIEDFWKLVGKSFFSARRKGFD